MKKIFLHTFVILALLFSVIKISAQTQAKPFQTIMDGNTKILKGLLNRDDIEKDTTFNWFKQNYNLGMANMPAITAFQRNAPKFQVVVFAGTWCEDTQNLLPVFYRLVDKSNYPDSNITLIGVDRKKATLNNLSSAFQIKEVPTFIIMKDGKEVGRVVEYGKYGQIDKELGEIVDSL